MSRGAIKLVKRGAVRLEVITLEPGLYPSADDSRRLLDVRDEPMVALELSKLDYEYPTLQQGPIEYRSVGFRTLEQQAALESAQLVALGLPADGSQPPRPEPADVTEVAVAQPLSWWRRLWLWLRRKPPIPRATAREKRGT
jgi:hypothetical protein